MFRKTLQKIFQKPVTRLAAKISSSPRKKDVFASLSKLLQDIKDEKTDRGIMIPLDMMNDKIIIVSDQHKGGGDLADDFHKAEKNYLTALKYYYENDFNLVNLGDCEELWENTPKKVIDLNRLSLGCLFLSLKSGNVLLKQTGRFFGPLIFLAGIFDIVENNAMLTSLQQGITLERVDLTYKMAISKFSVVLMSIFFMAICLVSWVAALLHRKQQVSNVKREMSILRNLQQRNPGS